MKLRCIENMRNILVIITTSFVTYGGLTTVMMNYYRAMDKSGVHIDFASTNEPSQELLDELHSNGSEYYCLGERNKNLFKYRQNLKKVLEKNKYDVIHVNGNSATMALELSVAKQFGVPVRIAHGHNSKTSHLIVHEFLKPLFNKMYTHAISVSKTAGDWLYGGNKYIILNNAIDLEKYRFNKEIRDKVRRNLKIDNKFVVGNVGKLNEQKNHTFLLKVFAELKKMRADVCLLLVGGGHLETDLRNECRALNIENDVIFTGMVNNASDYFQAMDVFVFPSLWEGFPLSVVEAQTSGLPCVLSKKVTKNVKYLENVFFEDISEGKELWAKKIEALLRLDLSREMAVDKMINSDMNIVGESRKLQIIYMSR